MNKEIGSEFEYWEPVQHVSKQDLSEVFSDSDCCFVFSGRTAIQQVLEDANVSGKVLLPDYCCDSMIEPFRRRGMEVDFYRVDYHDGLQIKCGDVDQDCKALLYCNYFGFKMPFLEEDIIEAIHDNGGIFIEDVTHSLLSDSVWHPESDYAVASLRKWFPIPSGGLAVKRNGIFKDRFTTKPDDCFAERKLNAMRLKKTYIDSGYQGNKKEFLDAYAESNAWLREHYSELAIDDISRSMLGSFDYIEIRNKRRDNAAVLYGELRSCKRVRFLFEEDLMDCPLFVPVLLDSELRENARQRLIKASVYCPVHWPVPSKRCRSGLYDQELSLVCDQRYDADDMRRIAAVLKACCDY